MSHRLFQCRSCITAGCQIDALIADADDNLQVCAEGLDGLLAVRSVVGHVHGECMEAHATGRIHFALQRLVDKLRVLFAPRR